MLKLSFSRYIKTSLGTYIRALDTNEFIYFVNFEECDENASVKMFDRKRNLISDNYFAYEAFMEALRPKNKNKVISMSDKLKEHIKAKKLRNNLEIPNKALSLHY